MTVWVITGDKWEKKMSMSPQKTSRQGKDQFLYDSIVIAITEISQANKIKIRGKKTADQWRGSVSILTVMKLNVFDMQNELDGQRDQA